jgi:hypothetical protein
VYDVESQSATQASGSFETTPFARLTTSLTVTAQ